MKLIIKNTFKKQEREKEREIEEQELMKYIHIYNKGLLLNLTLSMFTLNVSI